MKTLLCALLLLSSACTTPKSTTAVRPYPLDTCIVMDSKLGSMGDPVVRIYNGQEIKFCCPPCLEEFESNPEHYLENLPTD